MYSTMVRDVNKFNLTIQLCHFFARYYKTKKSFWNISYQNWHVWHLCISVVCWNKILKKPIIQNFVESQCWKLQLLNIYNWFLESVQGIKQAAIETLCSKLEEIYSNKSLICFVRWWHCWKVKWLNVLYVRSITSR